MNHKTVIVGAGPAGLAGAFWRLQRDPEADLVVFEAGPRVGGWVRTEVAEGYRCELGPQAVRPGAELDQLVEALGIADRLVPASPAAKSRWIGRGGKLFAVPAGPVQFLRTPLLSIRGKARLFAEPFVRAGDPTGEELTSFVRRRFGAETAPLVQAMVSGIFAGDADRLETESAFPTLAAAERAGGSVVRGMRALRRKRRAAGVVRRPRPKASLYSFDGGMSGLVEALAERLGSRVRVAAPVRRLLSVAGAYRVELAGGEVVDADEVVLACPASRAAEIVRGLDGGLAGELGSIPYASVASVYLGIPTADLPPSLTGFGFLLEPGENSPVLGAIYAGSLFPEHAPAGRTLLRVMIGGRRFPEVVERSDGSLVDLAVTTVMRYTGCRPAPEFVRVRRARAGIAQYEVGHARRIARIERLLEAWPGLSLRGNSYRAVALSGQLGRESGFDTGGESRSESAAADAVGEPAPVRS